MLSDLGDLCLNFWDKGPLKLDNWQIDIINMIKNNNSIVDNFLKSSGKSFIAKSTGIIHTNILYICVRLNPLHIK